MIDARITTDTITPDLAKRIRAFGDKRGLLEAMGAAVVTITKAAFRQSSLRASVWAPLKTKTGRPILYKSGALWQSPTIVSISNETVTVGSDRPYAAAHQFGAVITPKKANALFWPGAGHPVKKVVIPARPFFPFTSAFKMTAEASRRVVSTIRGNIAAATR
jgi:phage gpG-like protein